MQERLQKYLSRCGVASRRKSEEIIKAGRVKVNGKIIQDIVTIDDSCDVIEIDGVILKPMENSAYIMLNKPVGVITSAKDQFNRKTVVDLIDVKERVYPVGRLDYDTSGLLILTNDGDTANRIMHPSNEIEKVYIAEVIGIPSIDEMKKFENGLDLDGYITSHAAIKIIASNKNSAAIEITIHEGKNRQVRRMCEKIGHPVIKLKRIRIGKLSIGGMKIGEWRYLKDEEIEYLKEL